MNRIIVVATGIIILALINFSIWQQESHLAEGESIRLKLAPVDPRSIMQGDYMALNYELGRQIRASLTNFQGNASIVEKLRETEGLVITALDENRVAHFVRLDDGQPLIANQRALQYRVRNNTVKFATNAFFFAEGEEPLYRNAEYGEFRVNSDGAVLLTGLCDKDFVLLGD